MITSDDSFSALESSTNQPQQILGNGVNTKYAQYNNTNQQMTNKPANHLQKQDKDEDTEHENVAQQQGLEQELDCEPTSQDSDEDLQEINDLHEVHLDDGEKITIAELKDGYWRRQDYLSKQQDIVEQKNYVQKQAKILAHSADSLAQLINHHMPADPHPSLAQTDPSAYQNIINLRQQALNIINHFVEEGRYPDKIAKELDAEHVEIKLKNENEKLENIFPQTKDPAQRESFFQNIFKIGKKIGFQEEEMKNIIDHRLLVLAHYAQLGLQSQKISEDVYRKIRHKPSVSSVPNRKKSNNHHRITSQQRAIQKLQKSGSFYDALDIDFV